MTSADIPQGKIQGRVVAVHRAQCDVDIPGQKRWILCSLRGSLKEIKKDEVRQEVVPVTVGDQVLIEFTDEEHGVICEVLPRKSELARPAIHREHIKQVLCANVDQVAILVSLREPRFKAQVVDRLVVIALWGNIQPVILLTKTDLAKEAEIEKIRAMYQGFKVPLVCLSTLKKQGTEEVKDICRSKVTAFCGQSGVGKSTLLNYLAGKDIVPTGEVNRKTGKGRHTTTWSEIYSIEDGEIIDLPGNRQFGLWQIEPWVLSTFLSDIAELGRGCHFQPCSHIHEPKCQVQQAVLEGELDEARYLNYARIYESLVKH